MSPVADAAGQGSIRSVLTALRVVEALAQGPLGVSELARTLGMPKTTAHRNLRTLAAAGWVRPADSDRSRWMLTSRPLTVGLSGSIEGGLREVAVAEMTKLRDATGETVHLVIADPPELVVVARVDGTRSLRTFLPLGARAPLHGSASGRALLSVMSEEQVDEVLAAGLKRYTSTTLMDKAAILAEVEAARRRGYATNRAEWRTDIAAIGVAIKPRMGGTLGALAISMPMSRFEQADLGEIGERAIDAARHIAAQMHDWHQGDIWLG